MAALRTVALVICVAACGRFNFDPVAGDGGTGDGTRADASYATRAWAERTNASQPGNLFAPRLAYHAGLDSVMLYGGADNADTYHASMWRLTATGWVSVCDPCLPGPLLWPAFAYDPIGDRLLLYGGDNKTTYSDKLFAWDGVDWQQLAVTSVPGPRRRASWVHDTKQSRMLLIGGETTGSSTNDVWSFDGAQFTALGAPAGPRAFASDGTGVAYDPDLGVIALVDYGAGSPSRDDMWTWNGSWSQVCSSCTGHGRVGASLLVDPVLAQTLIVNGYDTDRGEELAGTWQVGASSATMVSTDPPQRDSSGAVYDAARDVFVLYGGNGDSCDISENCDETWELAPVR